MPPAGRRDSRTRGLPPPGTPSRPPKMPHPATPPRAPAGVGGGGGPPAAPPAPARRPARPPGALPAPSGPTIKPPHPRPAGGPLRGLRRAAPARRLRRRPCGAPHKTAPCTFSAPWINPAPGAPTTAESFAAGVWPGRGVVPPGGGETPCAFSLPGLFLPKKGLHLRSVCGIIL